MLKSIVSKKLLSAVCLAVFVCTGFLGCGGCQKRERITISIDGSSTIYPISQAAAEEFQKQNSNVKVTVGTSGTGGGFKKFVRGETDINDASRPIKPDEIKKCKENGIEYLELKVAIDGLSVVVNKKNDWCKALTVEQLKRIWEPGSEITSWEQIDPSFTGKPPLKLYGPDTDSGTFDYFTEVVCGENGAIRKDYTPSSRDTVLVQGVSGDEGALGYFGYAYYVKNKDKLNVVAVSATNDVQDAVVPTNESIEAGKYIPLSRPLFLYVNKAALKRPEVASFLRFYLSDEGQELVGEAGYVRLSESAIKATRKQLEDAVKEARGE